MEDHHHNYCIAKFCPYYQQHTTPSYSCNYAFINYFAIIWPCNCHLNICKCSFLSFGFEFSKWLIKFFTRYTGFMFIPASSSDDIHELTSTKCCQPTAGFQSCTIQKKCYHHLVRTIIVATKPKSNHKQMTLVVVIRKIPVRVKTILPRQDHQPNHPIPGSFVEEPRRNERRPKLKPERISQVSRAEEVWLSISKLSLNPLTNNSK